MSENNEKKRLLALVAFLSVAVLFYIAGNYLVDPGSTAYDAIWTFGFPALLVCGVAYKIYTIIVR